MFSNFRFTAIQLFFSTFLVRHSRTVKLLGRTKRIRSARDPGRFSGPKTPDQPYTRNTVAFLWPKTLIKNKTKKTFIKILKFYIQNRKSEGKKSHSRVQNFRPLRL